MKKISLFLTLTLIVCFVMPFSVYATDIEKGYIPATSIEITAQAVLLKDLNSGEILYEKNADASIYPASLTKVMTAIIALENTPNIDSEIVTYPMDVQDYLYKYQKENGLVSTGDLLLGEEMPMRDYLYAALLPSANEAAMTIAHHVAGSQESFVKLMNERAKELGAKNTNFENVTGLFDDDHISCLRDLAIFTEHALQFPDFKEIVSTYDYETGPTNKHTNNYWVSTNAMMDSSQRLTDSSGTPYYYEGLKGVKTGTLPQVGRCFISTVERDGYHYMLLLVGSDMKINPNGSFETDNSAFKETAAIYDWVFDSFKNRTLVEKGKLLGQVNVELSKEQDVLQLYSDDFVTAFMPDDVDTVGDSSGLEMELVSPESVEAPIEKGQKIGEYIINYDGKEVARVNAVAGSSIEASTLLIALRWIENMGSSFWFKFALIFIGLLVVAYIVLVIIRNRNKRRRSRGYRSRRGGPKF